MRHSWPNGIKLEKINKLFCPFILILILNLSSLSPFSNLELKSCCLLHFYLRGKMIERGRILFSLLRFLHLLLLTILWGFVSQHCASCETKVLVAAAAALDLATGVFHFTVAYFRLLCFDCATLRNQSLAKFRSNSEFRNTVKPDVCFSSYTFRRVACFFSSSFLCLRLSKTTTIRSYITNFVAESSF